MTWTTRSGDTWDVIARAVYGDESRADVLMEANREKLGTFIFSEGETLEAPALQTRRDGGLPPWKFEADYEG